MIQLSLPMQDTSWNNVKADTVDVKVLILYPFYVEADAKGNSFNIKKEDVYAIHDNYNKKLKSKWEWLKRLGKDKPLKYVENIANILDHESKTNNIVGHVIGELSIIEKDEVPYLFATLRVKGEENVKKVNDGRFSQVSIGLAFEAHELLEISWVVRGAIPHAGVSMSDGSKIISDKVTNLSVTSFKEYNPINLLNLRMALLSQYDFHRKEKEEIRNEIEIESMLTSLAASGKLLPRDKIRIKTQLNKISDKKSRFAAFNLLSENLITVIDYGIHAKNKSSINWEDNLMSGTKKNNVLDLQKIVQFAAYNLGKGSKVKMSEKEDGKKGEMASHEDKAHMGEEKSKFSKKDLKHCLSIKEDEKELSKYLSSFLSDDDQGDDAEMSAQMDAAKFSTEMKSLNSRQDETDKKLSDVLEKITILSKGTEESVALFKQITQAVELQKA